MIRRGPGFLDPEDLANLGKGDFQIAVPDLNAIVLEERILGISHVSFLAAVPAS